MGHSQTPALNKVAVFEVISRTLYDYQIITPCNVYAVTSIWLYHLQLVEVIIITERRLIFEVYMSTVNMQVSQRSICICVVSLVPLGRTPE